MGTAIGVMVLIVMGMVVITLLCLAVSVLVTTLGERQERNNRRP